VPSPNSDRAADARLDGKGGYLIVLPHTVLDRLKAMRGLRESYSDVILRAAGEDMKVGGARRGVARKLPHEGSWRRSKSVKDNTT
jgi:hypothetical protein